MFIIPPTREVPIRMLERAARGAVANGVALDRLLEECGVIRVDDGREQAVSPVQYLLLFTMMGRELQDFTHGLAARRFDGLYSRILIDVLLGSATLQGAIEAVQRLLKVGGSPIRIELSTDHHMATVRLQCDGWDEQSGIVAEDTWIGWLCMCFQYFLGGALEVSSIQTRDPQHISLGRLHYWVMAPVQLGSCAALSFSSAWLAAPRVAKLSDTGLHWEILRLWLESFERRIAVPSAQSPADLSLLRFDHMARAAGVSDSTYRRRMKQTLGGYRQARQRSLVDAGVSLLQGSDASVDAIAVELGYSEARSFRRFMKSATGMTPDQIRVARGNAPNPGFGAGAAFDHLREVALQLDLAG